MFLRISSIVSRHIAAYSNSKMMLLPLTIFEKYMFLDDRPEYPMDSFRQLTFSGHLDIDVFLQSIAAAVRWNPMLRSVVKQAGRNCFWEETDAPFSVRRSQGTESPIPERIQLQNEPGFKVYTAEAEEQTRKQTKVLLQFHHSVSDGIGEMQFIGDVLSDYNIRVTGQTPPENPRKLDPALLPLRGQSGLTLKSYLRNFLHTTFTTRQLLFGKPDPLAPCSGTQTTLDKYYAFCHQELSLEETSQYFAAAKTNNVTVNDILLRDLFLTMGQWRQRWVDQRTNPMFRVAVPMNLRTEQHRNIPAANVVTMLFLDRRLKQCLVNPEQLLQGVRREMDWIKKTEQKHYLLTTLQVRDLVFGGLGPLLRLPQCRTTVVFSNLGRVWESLPLPRREDGCLKAGEAVLESADATPPIRPGTLISFSALTYAGRIRFILRYDPLNMTAEQANDFLQRFLMSIRASSLSRPQ